MSVLDLANEVLRSGRLCLTDGDTHDITVGPPDRALVATLRFTSPATLRKVLRDPRLALGEAYMHGAFEVVQGNLCDAVTMFLNDVRGGTHSPTLERLNRLARWLRPLRQLNSPISARRRIAHHYDIDGEFYSWWLDPNRLYSCAYFATPEMTLEEAQREKMRVIARKLRLEPGMRVLDVGCGWGALAMHLAREHHVRVTGLTLSVEQQAYARDRVEEAGLDGQVEILLQDYREHEQTYDRVVSVGMLEHVGTPQLRTFFETVSRLMGRDGVALVHSIARTDPPGVTNPFIDRYIFPGGYIPSLSEMARAFEGTRLVAADIDVWRLHYAETLRAWRMGLERVRDRVVAKFDEQFYRMWEFYLIISEASFRSGMHVVHQIQLANDVGALPATRAYMNPVR